MELDAREPLLRVESFDVIETPLDEMPEDILYPFAWDELMCRRVGEGRRPILHIWRHGAAFVMGMRDRRLANAEQAMANLRNRGLSVGVRNSGGAAVPLDPGVVNVSVILPNPEGRLDFHDDFRLMVRFIEQTLAPWGAAVKAGEIEGSYCPGDYDVSLKGRKFCGIAQRRQTKAFVVSAFVVVTGSGMERAKVVRQFYEEAADHKRDQYPLIRPEMMASLQELAGVPSAEAYIAAIKQVALSHGGRAVPHHPPLLPEREVQAMMDELRDRYDRQVRG